MNLDEFLHLRGADLASIATKVKEIVGLEARDVLLAVGSLVEGLGTSKSDLDLLLITPRTKRDLSEQDSLALVAGNCLVDLRVLRLDEFENILTRLDSWSRTPWNVVHAVKFTADECTLLHRVLHGYPIYQGEANRVRIPKRIDLACLKLHVARQAARTIQVDMVGHLDRGDYRSLGFAAQDLLGHAVDALCAGHQLTNPLAKWRSRLLESLPTSLASMMTQRPTGLTMGEAVWRLHRAPKLPAQTLSLEHASRITAFARSAFWWAELKLVQTTSSRHELKPWPKSKSRRSHSRLPHLQFDLDFFLGGDRVKAGRLNEFGGTIELSPQEFGVILLCDGTTTAHEAQLAIFGPGEAEAELVHHLLSELARAGLTITPRNE